MSNPSPSTWQDLDIEQPAALLAYLRATGYIAPDETPEIRRLAGGVSNRTVWVKRPSGETWVMKQALEKLRVPVDWFSSPERVHREALGLRRLRDLAPAQTIPPLVFEDHAAHLIAMQAVPEPHANWKTLLLAGQLDQDHVTQFAVLLATIHANAYAQRDALQPVFADRGFFESLRLEPYYGYTAEQVPAAHAFLTDLIAATRARAQTLVHGDYSPKNILVHAGRLILLDHEVIHWGDPAFDLGFSLTHLLSKAHHLRDQRDAFAAAAHHYWTTYRQRTAGEAWAGDIEAYAVRHTLACLLARVAGRSPLEYLAADARARQQAVVTRLMADPPAQMDALIAHFVQAISARDDAA